MGIFFAPFGKGECFYSRETCCDERMERRAQRELCPALNLFPVGSTWRRKGVIAQILGEGEEQQRLCSSSASKPAFDAHPAEGLSFLTLCCQPLENEGFFLMFSQNSQCCSLCLFPWLFPLPAGEGRGLSSLPPSQTG